MVVVFPATLDNCVVAGGDMLFAVYWVVREWVVERPSEIDAI